MFYRRILCQNCLAKNVDEYGLTVIEDGEKICAELQALAIFI